MGRCGHGPNVEVINGDQASVVSGIASYELLEQLAVSRVARLEVSSLQRKVARIKYDVRREQSPEKKSHLLEEGFNLIGERSDHLMCELLVLRAQVQLNNCIPLALSDARLATQLVPTSTQAHLALADVQEAAGHVKETAASLRKALLLGKGLGSDRSVVAQRLALLEGSTDRLYMEYLPWRVVETTRLSHNAILISLESKDLQATAVHLGGGDVWHLDVRLPVGATTSEEAVERSYTPSSSAEDYQEGRVAFAIKIYAGGKLTPHLETLRPGDELELSPPQQTMEPDSFTGLLMVAGGSSVTVALQLCESVLRRHPKRGQVRLVLCNHVKEDVWFLDRLHALLDSYAGFKIIHCIAEGPLPNPHDRKGQWRSGRVGEQVLARIEPHLRAVVSGPPGLCIATVSLLSRLGRPRDKIEVLDGDVGDELADLGVGPQPSITSYSGLQDSMDMFRPPVKQQIMSAGKVVETNPAVGGDEASDDEPVTAAMSIRTWRCCSLLRR